MNLRSLLLTTGACLLLSGCTLLQHTLNAFLPPPWTKTEQQSDQKRQQSMNNYLISATISRLGEQLCRPLQTGIVGQDWIKGEVLGYSMHQVEIKITEAGHEPHELQGSMVVAGRVLWDEGSLWMPCR